ncbi:MAG: hypothetical protein FJX72_15425 [Armatimonadetes bacterium]|nr:hypothetical protein [Armatimonadota bacterium]
MPVPYRRAPAVTVQIAIAYLAVVRSPGGAYLGAILLTDARGRPIEFVHNRIEAPRGFMWPEDQVRASALTAMCHSLFEACTRDPALLLAEADLGSPDFCREALAPSVPFALLGADDWVWVGRPPAPGIEAHSLAEELRSRSDPLEPFSRIRIGLREVYPGERWGASGGADA